MSQDFTKHIEAPVGEYGCWLWTGARDERGYGFFRVNGKTRRAHRVVYADLIGSIGAGLELDHLCRNHSCVHPNHLEPVTHKVNVRRGALALINTGKTACPLGHLYDAANTYITPTGARRCLICRRAAEKRYHARKRAI